MEAPNCQRYTVAIVLNHTIIFAEDKQTSASFFASLFGLPDPVVWGPFLIVALGEGGMIQFAEANFVIQPQHYAFLVTETKLTRSTSVSSMRAWNTGQTRKGRNQASSTGTTVDEASTSATRQATVSKSSPARTAWGRRPADQHQGQRSGMD